jgi:uncharacterized protein (DUF488 family)
MESVRSQKQSICPDPEDLRLRDGNASLVYTIGHSSHTPDRLIALLEGAGIQAISDVRSMPFSRWLPHVNRLELDALLRAHGIAYRFLGDRLGGRPPHRELYDPDGRVDYDRLRRTALFEDAVEQLCRQLLSSRIALLCSEEDPLVCHRGLLIARALAERGVQAMHLRGDGRLESGQEAEDRILRETGLVVEGSLDLFAEPLTGAERERLLAEAYRHQARRYAYRVRPGAPAPWTLRGDEEPG